MDAFEKKLAAKIGQAVRTGRGRLHWSQALLAEQLDTSVEYISLLERGERLPSVGTLAKLAEILGVPIGALFDGQASPENDPAEALLAAVPEAARPVVIAMLRGVVDASRKKKRKRR